MCWVGTEEEIFSPLRQDWKNYDQSYFDFVIVPRKI